MDEKIATKKPLIVRLQLLLTIMALLAPVFYLIGLAFYNSFLSTYGISSDTFTFTIQDIYVGAYLAITEILHSLSDWIILVVKDLITPPELYWLTAFILILFLFFYSVAQSSTLKEKVAIQKIIFFCKKIADKLHWENNNLSAAALLTAGVLYLMATVLFVFFALFSYVALPYLIGSLPGKYLANTSIDSFLENGCHYEKGKRWSNCKILQSKDGKILYEGILIASTETRIAFFTKSGAVVAQIPDGALIINTPKGL